MDVGSQRGNKFNANCIDYNPNIKLYETTDATPKRRPAEYKRTNIEDSEAWKSDKSTAERDFRYCVAEIQTLAYIY